MCIAVASFAFYLAGYSSLAAYVLRQLTVPAACSIRGPTSTVQFSRSVGELDILKSLLHILSDQDQSRVAAFAQDGSLVQFASFASNTSAGQLTQGKSRKLPHSSDNDKIVSIIKLLSSIGNF